MTSRRTLVLLPVATVFAPMFAKRDKSPKLWEVVGNIVRVRAGPSTDSPVIAVLRGGDSVYRTGKIGGDPLDPWIGVRLQTGEVGWIRDDQIGGIAPTPTPIPTSTPLPTATLPPTATPTVTATPPPTATPQPTSTPLPTATPLPTPVPTSTPMPTPTLIPAEFPGSRSIGLTFAEAQAIYGPSQPDLLGRAWDISGGRLVLGRESEVGCRYAERFFDPGLRFETAQSHVRRLAPRDAVLVRTYESMDRTIELFHSDWLERRFAGVMLDAGNGEEIDPWINGEPGQFAVSYGAYNPAAGMDVVGRVVMGTGNNA